MEFLIFHPADVLGGDSTEISGSARGRGRAASASVDVRVSGQEPAPILLEGAYEVDPGGEKSVSLLVIVAGDGPLEGTLEVSGEGITDIELVRSGQEVFFHTLADFASQTAVVAEAEQRLTTAAVEAATLTRSVEHTLYGRFAIDTGLVQDLAQISYERPGYRSHPDWMFVFVGERNGLYTFSVDRAIGPRTGVVLIGADVPAGVIT